MNDKELLELAAKAAGYKYDSALKVDGLWASIAPNGCYAIWRPLTDDGDALRLAVKLRLSPEYDEDEIYVSAHPDFTASEFGKDPYVATRRAIVRAAAEIGRNMK